MPVSDAFSSGERAGLAGAGAGVLVLWVGVEPLTGAIAAGLAALWGWASGKSLKRMQEEARENVLVALEPRLDDFLDSFADNLLKLNDARLLRMREVYLAAFGPDDNPILGRQTVLRPSLKGRVLNRHGSGPGGGPPLGSFDGTAGNDALVRVIRDIVGGQGGSKLWVAPNIPEGKLTNAIDSYAQGTRAEDVLFLYDDTVWGSAKNGFCLTPLLLFWRNMGEEAQRMDLADVRSVAAQEGIGILGTPHLKVNGKPINVTDKGKADVLKQVIQAVRDRPLT